MIRIRGILVFWLLVVGPGQAQDDVNFDKLSDCAALAKLRTLLNSPPSDDCREARGRVENKWMSQFAGVEDEQACLMSAPPVSRLAGFSCVDLSYKGTRELTCFKAVSSVLLKGYRDNYESVYRAKVYKYLAAAAKCDVGNGDASAAPQTLFPAPLYNVASVNFGFVLGIGRERASTSRAYHGYADVDPEIDRSTRAIEVFDIINIRGATLAPPQSLANGELLKVETDDLSDAEGQMSEALERQFGLPVEAKIRMFEFTYGGRGPVSQERRNSDLDGWQRGAASELVQAGFRPLRRSDLAGTRFRDPDELGAWIIDHMPFGKRGLSREIINPHVAILLDDRLDSCIRIGEIMVKKPEQGVLADYGGMAMVLLDEGNGCYEVDASSDELADKLTDYIKNEVTRR